MTKKKIHILLSVIVFCLATLQTMPAMAQERKASRIEKKADRNFARQKFDKAMGQYETAIDREKVYSNQAELYLKTARLYFMVRNYAQSAEHYGKAMEMFNSSLSVNDVCNYVDALRFIGEDQKAEAICLDNAFKDIYSRYQRYQNTLDALAMKHDLVADPGYMAARLNVNTQYSEYWVGIYGNQPFYAMSYSNFNDPGKLFFHRSYYYELNETGEPDGEKQKSPKFSDYFRGIPVDLQNGPVSFSPGRQMMVATVVEYKNSAASVDAADRANRPFYTKLHYSVLKNDRRRYSKYRPVFGQDDTYSYAHPYIINNGESMLFTSDMPGGYGGFDLYICHYDKTSGAWGDPINLGPGVNTEGDEIFPLLFEDRLIFASNGLPGYGGYDLFSVFFDNDGVIPGGVFHFPYPVNSVFNDYYMAPLDLQRAYFVSDREANGRDDIYYLRMVEDLNAQQAKPHYGLTEEAAVKGGQLLLSGLVEKQLKPTHTVELKGYAPEGLLLTLYFDFDSYELTSDSELRLQQFLAEMETFKFDELHIDGYADEVGSDSYNYTLSERRAHKVTHYLSDNGISADFVTQGKGRIKLTPQEIEQEIGRFTWSEEGVDWVRVNRRARRVEIYNKRINNKY